MLSLDKVMERCAPINNDTTSGSRVFIRLAYDRRQMVARGGLKTKQSRDAESGY